MQIVAKIQFFTHEKKMSKVILFVNSKLSFFFYMKQKGIFKSTIINLCPFAIYFVFKILTKINTIYAEQNFQCFSCNLLNIE